MISTKEQVSKATIRNWEKLGKNPNDNSLNKRANKKQSTKKIDPVEYLNNGDKSLADNLISKLNKSTDKIEIKIQHFL